MMKKFLALVLLSVQFLSNNAFSQSQDFTNSVAGIDVNNNGVRDDIEDSIGKAYTDPKQRAAMMQYAAKLQNLLLNSQTKDAAFLSEKDVFRALECTDEVFGDSSSKLTLDVLAMTLNTRQRALAYAAAHKLSSGRVYEMFVRNPCDAQ
jgi:hypothetical protein